jgi:hypothetical protein
VTTRDDSHDESDSVGTRRASKSRSFGPKPGAVASVPSHERARETMCAIVPVLWTSKLTVPSPDFAVVIGLLVESAQATSLTLLAESQSQYKRRKKRYRSPSPPWDASSALGVGRCDHEHHEIRVFAEGGRPVPLQRLQTSTRTQSNSPRQPLPSSMHSSRTWEPPLHSGSAGRWARVASYC